MFFRACINIAFIGLPTWWVSGYHDPRTPLGKEEVKRPTPLGR
jgi:hypothetical protein